MPSSFFLKYIYIVVTFNAAEHPWSKSFPVDCKVQQRQHFANDCQKTKQKKKDHVRGILGRRVSAAFFCAQPLLCEVLIESAVLISSDLSRESAVSRTHVSIGEANGFSDGREPNWLKSITELESEGRYLLKSALMGELCGKSCSLGCRDCH